MKKLFLSLSSDNLGQEPIVTISEKRPYENNTNLYVRSSPIYEITSEFSFSELENNFSGLIILLFSIQPLALFNSLKYIREQHNDIKIYISQGFASLVLFIPSNTSIKLNFLDNQKYLIGYERWKIHENYVKEYRNILPDFRHERVVDVNLEAIELEEQFIFSDIISSLNLAYSYSNALFKTYIPILDEVKRKVLYFYYTSLYLNKKIAKKKFRQAITKNSILNENDLDLLIQHCKDSKSIEPIFIKDDIIQIASVLKNSNSQLFGNIPVIQYGMFQSGKNSLLGIGNHVVGFLSIYLHIRNCFSKYNFENIFENIYLTIKSPKFLLQNDLESYCQWFSIFKDEKGLDTYIKQESIDSTYHIVCFSNRQGFRVTNHSVSAAMQSLYLSFLPSFTLNTLSHELLHAHVHAEIMTEMYPLDENNQQAYNLNNVVYEKYRSLFTKPKEYYNLKEYIQINFLLMAGKLVKPEDFDANNHLIQKAYSAENLSKILCSWHKEIEEIIVHILDLLYFYNSDESLYIKAIWISWLSLPFSVNNLKQYILRSLCAITSVKESSDLNGRFDEGLKILEKELLEIKKINFVNSNFVDIVLSHLRKKDIMTELRYEYINAFVYLVDFTKKFFFSSGLKSLLNQDEELTESKENEYTYDLSTGDFENRTINSPIALINDVNKHNISDINTLNNLDKIEIERLSSWLNSLIVTSLKKYEVHE